LQRCAALAQVDALAADNERAGSRRNGVEHGIAERDGLDAVAGVARVHALAGHRTAHAFAVRLPAERLAEIGVELVKVGERVSTGLDRGVAGYEFQAAILADGRGLFCVQEILARHLSSSMHHKDCAKFRDGRSIRHTRYASPMMEVHP